MSTTNSTPARSISLKNGVKTKNGRAWPEQ